MKRHLDLCRVQNERIFKCHWPGCNKAFTRNQALQHHFALDHQQRGAGIKRAAKPVELQSKKPKTMVPDEEKVALDGVRVDATFYPQTKEEQRDLKIFLRDTLERLKQRLEQAIKQKRSGVKWNLFLLIELKIEQTYSEYPWRVTPTPRAGPYTSTNPEELEKQLRIASHTSDEMFTHFQCKQEAPGGPLNGIFIFAVISLNTSPSAVHPISRYRPSSRKRKQSST